MNIRRTAQLMPQSPIVEVDNLARLKIKINTLLWEELPGATTLVEAEEIACDIICRIKPLPIEGEQNDSR